VFVSLWREPFAPWGLTQVAPSPTKLKENPLHNTARRSTALLSLLSAVALLAACGSTTKLDQPAPVAMAARTTTPAATPTGPNGGATASGTPQSQVATVDLASRSAPTAPADGMAMAPSQRIVYFDFDSFAVRPEFNGMVEAHAKYLTFNRDKRMAIEGHTDDRGSREYNLALGQKRAEAVLRSLVLLGAQENQLEAVSFGEERPAATGSDEAAWAQNRRAEVKER
jgi:peptidoglycan-associated lipoprotein